MRTGNCSTPEKEMLGKVLVQTWANNKKSAHLSPAHLVRFKGELGLHQNGQAPELIDDEELLKRLQTIEEESKENGREWWGGVWLDCTWLMINREPSL